MEISNTHQVAQVSGVIANSFGFEMNAKMYDILISKMYTNKPGAVIRELSANAWDAHKEAGMEETPFELHLPTWLDKSFFLRDYGTGIPHQLFEHIYTNVGSSTKEGTNELIGGFGLGSKTPFTMTDTFMVENWYGGIKSTWICFKDKGEPQVSKVAEEPSDEPSGLKVSFSFDEGDVPEFTKQVTKQLRFFPVKPKITGGEGTIDFPALPEGWETKDYFYTKDGTYGKTYVSMGNIAYLVTSTEFPSEYRNVFSSGLVLQVPIGAVDIPPSREALEMTPKTKAFITTLLDRIKREYGTDTQAALDKLKTKWDVRKFLHKVNFSLLGTRDTLLFQGLPVDWSLHSSCISSCVGYPIYTADNLSYKQVYRKSSIRVTRVIDGLIPYYVNDLGAGGSSLINEKSSSIPRNAAIFHVGNLTKATKDTAVAKALLEIEAEIGENPILLSSLLGFPPVKVKGLGAPARVTNKVFSLSGNVCQHSSLKSQLTEVTSMPTSGYYVELHRWNLVSGVPSLMSMLIKGLADLLGEPLYAIRTTAIPKLPDSMTLVTTESLQWLLPIIEERCKTQGKRELIHDSVHRIPELHNPVFSVLKDKKFQVYKRYAAYVLRKPRGCSKALSEIRDCLSKDAPTPIIPLPYTLPSKLQLLIDAYSPIANLLNQVCSRYNWDKAENEKRIESLIDLITQNK